jgi:hypothetical protein
MLQTLVQAPTYFSQARAAFVARRLATGVVYTPVLMLTKRYAATRRLLLRY